jgi:hypothetical protein
MDHVAGEDHTIERPADYAFWRDYVPPLAPAWPGKLLSWWYSAPTTLKPKEMGINPTGPTPPGIYNLWTYRRIADRSNFAPGTYPGDVCLVNWPQNDYLLGNLFGPADADPAAAAAAAARHAAGGRELSRCLFYWMQTEAPRPDGGQGWKGLRLRPEIAGTDDGMAMAPYVRESRRIRAEFTVTETTSAPTPGPPPPASRPASSRPSGSPTRSASAATGSTCTRRPAATTTSTSARSRSRSRSGP